MISEKGVLINFTILPTTLFKKRLWPRCFPVNFAKYLRTPIFIEHLWWLLLAFVRYLEYNQTILLLHLHLTSFDLYLRKRRAQECHISSKSKMQETRKVNLVNIWNGDNKNKTWLEPHVKIYLETCLPCNKFFNHL